jgi:hypothetical protein
VIASDLQLSQPVLKSGRFGVLERIAKRANLSDAYIAIEF